MGIYPVFSVHKILSFVMFTENVTEKATFVYQNTSSSTISAVVIIFLTIFVAFGLLGLILYLEHIVRSRISCWKFTLAFVVYFAFLIWFIVEMGIDISFTTWHSTNHGEIVAASVIIPLILGIHAFCGVFMAVNHLCKKEKVEEPTRNRYGHLEHQEPEDEETPKL
jgi:glucan phosphoethanolaminetransferase (alkaline phosphatase superfamily)